MNFTINISDDSLLVRGNPTFFSVNKSHFVNISYELFDTQETANAGDYNVTKVGCFDSESNFAENTTNFPFAIIARPPGEAGLEGGGGGADIIFSITKVENVTQITGQCNFNGICEAEFGEDFLNCNIRNNGDCEFSLAQINPLCVFIPQPGTPCIYRTGLFARLAIVLFVLSILILATDTPQIRKFRKKAGDVIGIKIK